MRKNSSFCPTRIKIALKSTIFANIFLRVSYLIALWYLSYNGDSSLPNERNEAAWTAASRAIPEDITAPKTSKAIITESLNTLHQATRGLCLALPVKPACFTNEVLVRLQRSTAAKNRGTGWPARGGCSGYVKGGPGRGGPEGRYVFCIKYLHIFIGC